MSNIIDSIQLSGVTYGIKGSGGTETIELTQAQYDALVDKDPNVFYIITDAQAGDLTNYYTKNETNTLLGGKQATLVSGTNIKTINGESVLGSGNINIQGSGVNVVQTTGTSTTDVMSQNAVTSNFIYEINLNYMLNGRYTLALQSKDKNLFIPYMTINGKKVLSINDLSVIETSDVTTTVSSSSTDAQVPSAKAVYDAIQEGGGGGMTEDDELLLSTALTDLNDRKIDASEVKSNYQKKGDYVTTNTLNARLAEYETALDEQNVEEVTAYALNDLNNKFGGLKLVKITESEYAALTTKDENTLYIVVADPS